MHRITALGYMGVDTVNVDLWRKWAELIGATVVDDTGDSFGVRLDSEGPRIFVSAAEKDNISFAGWEAPNVEAWKEIRERLEAASANPEARPDLAAVRGVEDLITFRDPDGNNAELYWGRKTYMRTRFLSPHGVTFSTGDMGAGHVVYAVKDFRRTFDFYTEVLGMTLTETADVGGLRAAFMRCNPRHHSMSFAQLPSGESRPMHICLEVEHLDALGSIRDRLLEEGKEGGGVTIERDLGRHPGDGVISMYIGLSEVFEVEMGWGAIRVEDETWDQVRSERDSWAWGHRQLSGKVTQLGQA